MDGITEASNKSRKAISLLSDPNDLHFLRGLRDTKDRPARMAKLTEIVKECDATLFAKIAAGRLGLEYFHDFKTKFPSLEKLVLVFIFMVIIPLIKQVK